MLKTDVNAFLGKNLILNFLTQMGARNRPKMRFSKFYEKSMDEICLIFCMKLQQHNGLKLTLIIFCMKLQQHKGWKSDEIILK